MPRLSPFTGYLVAASRARAIVAPPYDALTPDQRTAMAAADPESFLNALPTSGPGDRDELEATLVACRASVERLIAGGRFDPLDRACLVIVGIGAPPTRTLAVVGDLPADRFDLEATGRPDLVRPHERVRSDRVHQLTRYLEVVRVASSPVAVTHRPSPAVAAATAEVVRRRPQLGFRGEDGTDLAAWVVDDPAEIDALTAAVDVAGTLYIADGHHRAAAVAAYSRGPSADEDGAIPCVLTAVIPSDHLAVLPFHRRIVGAPDTDAAAITGRLRAHGLEPVEVAGPQLPAGHGTVTVTTEGRWWSVALPEATEDGPVERLDVRRVERHVIPVLLDGDDGSARVEPSSGPAGLGALEGPATIGIALTAPPIDAILEVADAGQAMPPKTTYVTPKLRSGLLLAPR